VAEEQNVLARLFKTMISITDSIKRPAERDAHPLNAYILNARLYGSKDLCSIENSLAENKITAF
jgi:hypothetical protein